MLVQNTYPMFIMHCSPRLSLGALLLVIYLGFLGGCSGEQERAVIQTLKWQKTVLDFTGPHVAEDQDPNPFLDYRLMVTFNHGDRKMVVPGYFAADGQSGSTGAAAGTTWRVIFRPDEEGEWTYQVSFRQGTQIAISHDPSAGSPVAFDGSRGSILVGPPADGAQGRLIPKGRYLHYAESGKPYLKGGADSPENLLAYEDFDGTQRGTLAEHRDGEAAVDQLHTYAPHIRDWKSGDPSWRDGKGKGLIGGLNYLASKGVNSVYFLTMNIEGDGKDVWPYTGYDERFRFDCSKLDQWEIVFDHMDRLGLMLHVVLQETENEKLLDHGDTGIERKLYLRELIARYAHHLGVTWNLGEENGPASFSPNGQTTEQQKAMFSYIEAVDPYHNFAVVHSHSNPHHRDSLYELLLGFEYMDGMSVQTGNPAKSHDIVKQWLNASKEAGHPWIVMLDEIGPAFRGTDPDDRPDNNQDTIRAEVLWGTLMAGGGGVEWYFGYKNHNNDLECEDWRSRDNVWDFTRYGREFFLQHLPFTEMENHDDLLSGDQAYCFAKPGELYAVYLLHGGSCELDLSGVEGSYSVKWYNPRAGGGLLDGSVKSVRGGMVTSLGRPPSDSSRDWAILLTKQS